MKKSNNLYNRKNVYTFGETFSQVEIWEPPGSSDLPSKPTKHRRLDPQSQINDPPKYRSRKRPLACTHSS